MIICLSYIRILFNVKMWKYYLESWRGENHTRGVVNLISSVALEHVFIAVACTRKFCFVLWSEGFFFFTISNLEGK